MLQSKYNIRLVHLLLEDDTDPDRQNNSIQQLLELEKRGIQYIQVWNKRWTQDPPKETFARPNLFESIPIRPSHYGCFRAFADASLEYFTENIDALLICEGDVKLLDTPDRIVNRINQAYEATQRFKIDYFSLGSKYTLETNILQSAVIEKHGSIEIVNKVIGIQMIMFPQRIREYLNDCFTNSQWDGADIFLNQNFMGKKKIGIFDESPTGQWDGLSVIDDRNKTFMNSKKKVLYIAPHLSTGGMPQFLLKRVEALLNEQELEIHVIELNNYSNDFVVQKDKLKKLLGDRLYLAQHGVYKEQREERLLQTILTIKPDIIHIEECPEAFDEHNKLSNNTLSKIYAADRPYQIIETCHNIWMGEYRKKWQPNSYMYCTPFHPIENFKDSTRPYSVVEYPIEDLQQEAMVRAKIKLELGIPADKINVLNVGLWTNGKNQAEAIEIARIAEQRYPNTFLFHFVGNQAGNFQSYWKPLMLDLPSNVKIWGERNDTHLFYSSADVFMFNSTWECNPLAVREAISHRLPTFARNLPQYLDMFTPYIVPFSDSPKENADIFLIELLESGKNLGDFIPPQNDIDRFRTQHLQLYLEAYTNPSHGEPRFHTEYRDGFRLIVEHLPPGDWTAQFWDEDRIVYSTPIREGSWYSPRQNWFTPWRVEVLQGTEVVWNYSVEPAKLSIDIRIDSSSLGDCLVWMGQVERFMEHWGPQKVRVKSHISHIWDREYYRERGIEIVDAFSGESDVLLGLGVYYSLEEPWRRWEHRNDWRKIHMGQIASDRLGIPFSERRPRLDPKIKNPPLISREKPIVAFATQSTAGAKYWNNPTGWKDLVAGMSEYHWIHTSPEGGGVGDEELNSELETIAGAIKSSRFFVGLPSGLSWLAWALEVPTFIISGFSPSLVEESDGITIIRNNRVCNSCWSWDVFNKGDWNWCPAWKGTHRQFECTKEIGWREVESEIMDVIKKL